MSSLNDMDAGWLGTALRELVAGAKEVILEVNAKSFGHAVQGASIDAKNFRGAFAVSARNAQHVYKMLAFYFIHCKCVPGSLSRRFRGGRSYFILSNEHL
jgi:hypothetical protein